MVTGSRGPLVFGTSLPRSVARSAPLVWRGLRYRLSARLSGDAALMTGLSARPARQPRELQLGAGAAAARAAPLLAT